MLDDDKEFLLTATGAVLLVALLVVAAQYVQFDFERWFYESVLRFPR